MIYDNDQELLLFFKFLENSTNNIAQLTLQGYSYTDIAEALLWTIEKKYVKINEETKEYIITSLGKEKINSIIEKLKTKNILLARKDCKIQNTKLEEIYIPYYKLKNNKAH